MSIRSVERSSPPSSIIKPPRRVMALAKITGLVRSKPSLRTANSLTRLIFRTASGPVLHCPLCDEDHRFLPFGVPPD